MISTHFKTPAAAVLAASLLAAPLMAKAEPATYAIDREVAAKWRIRRYGFHGTSHEFVSRQAAAYLGAPVESLNQIVLHLGNGASASAIAAPGCSLDRSL